MLPPNRLLPILAIALLSLLAVAAENPGVELVLQNGHSLAPRALVATRAALWFATAGEDRLVIIRSATDARQLRTFHAPAPVSAMAVAPDDRTLAVLCEGGRVILLDVETGAVMREFRHGSGDALSGQALAFSPDGKLLAVPEDYSVRILSTSTWEQLASLEPPGRAKRVEIGDWVSGLAFSPDSRRLTVAGPHDDGGSSLYLWDWQQNKLLHAARLPKPYVNAFAQSPDARFIATACDANVIVRDARDFHVIANFSLALERVAALAFAPRGGRLAVGGELSTSTAQLQALSVHSLPGGKKVMGGSTLGVAASAYGAGGKLFTTGGHDTVIWDDDLRPVAAANVVAQLMTGAAFTGKSLLTSGIAQVWDLKSGERRGWFRAPLMPSADLLMSRDEAWVLTTGFFESYLWSWNRPQEKPLRLPPTLKRYWFTPDSRWLIGIPGQSPSGNPDPGTIQIFSPGQSQPHHVIASPGVHHAVVTPDSRYLVAALSDDTVRVWQVEDGKPVATLDSIKSVRRLAISADGARLALTRASLGNNDKGSVAMVDTATWKLASPERAPAISLFSPQLNLGWISLGFVDNACCVYAVVDTATGKELLRLPPRRNAPIAISFSPDGDRLALGDETGRLEVWDIAAGKLAWSATRHLNWIKSATFSPDGRWLATAGWDGTVRLWDARAGEERATLVSTTDGGWLVATPDGLFDGNQAGWSQLQWRLSASLHDVYPVENYFNEYFYPGLLAEIFAGGRPASPHDITRLDRRGPEVEIERDFLARHRPDEAMFNITLKSAPAGARDLRVFRNGLLVKHFRGDIYQYLHAGQLSVGVRLRPGERTAISAYAFNQDAVRGPLASTVAYTAPDSTSPSPPGTLFVLAIGINQYVAPRIKRLAYAVADAHAFAAELAQKFKSAAGSETVTIELTDQDATRDNILTALRVFSGDWQGPLPPALSAARPLQPADLLVIFYAGHGLAVADNFYLLPHDSSAELPAQPTGSKFGISDAEIADALDHADAGSLVLILDACNSGQALGAPQAHLGPMNARGLPQLAYDKGIWVLAAAQGFQAAFEVEKRHHGLLTFALVEEGLKTRAADRSPSDGVISVREWLEFAAERVPQLQREAFGAAVQHDRSFAFADNEADLPLDARSAQRPRLFFRRDLGNGPGLAKVSPGTE